MHLRFVGLSTRGFSCASVRWALGTIWKYSLWFLCFLYRYSIIFLFRLCSKFRVRSERFAFALKRIREKCIQKKIKCRNSQLFKCTKLSKRPHFARNSYHNNSECSLILLTLASPTWRFKNCGNIYIARKYLTAAARSRSQSALCNCAANRKCQCKPFLHIEKYKWNR